MYVISCINTITVECSKAFWHVKLSEVGQSIQKVWTHPCQDTHIWPWIQPQYRTCWSLQGIWEIQEKKKLRKKKSLVLWAYMRIKLWAKLTGWLNVMLSHNLFSALAHCKSFILITNCCPLPVSQLSLSVFAAILHCPDLHPHPHLPSSTNNTCTGPTTSALFTR